MMSKWGICIAYNTGGILINTTDMLDELLDLIDNEIMECDVTGQKVWVTGYMMDGINVSGMSPDDSYTKLGLKLAIADLKIGGMEHTVVVSLSDGSAISIQRIAPTSKCAGCVHDFVDRLQVPDTTLEDEREMSEKRFELGQPSSLTHQHRWEVGGRNGIKFRRCSCGLKQVHFGYAGSLWSTIDMIPEGVQF